MDNDDVVALFSPLWQPRSRINCSFSCISFMCWLTYCWLHSYTQCQSWICCTILLTQLLVILIGACKHYESSWTGTVESYLIPNRAFFKSHFRKILEMYDVETASTHKQLNATCANVFCKLLFSQYFQQHLFDMNAVIFNIR